MKSSEFGEIKSDPREILLQALDERWGNYRAELKNCQNDFTDEAIHDLRVATRRMLALIQLLNSISPRPRLKKMARAFKDQLDEFDDLRDTQVILAELAQIIQELPQLEEYEQHLHSQEAQMLLELNQVLEERDPSKLDGWIRKTQKEIEAWGGKDLSSLVQDAVDDAFLTVRQRLGWVDLTRSATIHRVRVAFKAFRYMVEIVQPLLNHVPPDILKQMNEYQTLMGNIQDTEVFAQTLAGFAKDHPFPDAEAIHHYYQKRRSTAISAYVNAMEQLHAFWRPAPDQPFPWE